MLGISCSGFGIFLNQCLGFGFAVWADADTWFERQQQEEELQKLQVEHDARVKAAEEEERKLIAAGKDVEVEEDVGDDPMAQAEAEAIAQDPEQ